ncbi:CHAT domain-containing protein [Phyllosticta citrichinensis]
MTNSDIAAVYASRLADLNEAIAYFQQSLAAGDSTRRNWGNQAFGVAFLLLYGAELTGDNSPIPHTMKLLVMSVENDGEAPLSRVSTASRILRYLWSDIEGVVELQDRLAKIAIDLLPYACSRERLSREDQQYAIRVTEGFAADSFSFSIKLGNVEEALQRVEYSRGLIMGHLIDRKDNFTNLKKKHIDLAKKYLDLRDRAFHPIVEEKLSGKWESVIEEQRKAHLKLRDCEEEIRRQPGFENFQKLTSLEELQGHILDNTAPDGSENWLVYLSACSTAQVKADKMGDESLHLASAFQVAGFAHAIGSLWSADDDICVEVARLFYQVLSKYTGTERKVAVAHALRKAVIQIRDQHYDKPALWAPFIHFGA